MPASSIAWGVDEIRDAPGFVGALAEILPEATHLEVEGSAIVREARNVYRAHADGSGVRSARQTLFPWSQRERCRLSAPLLAELRALLERYAVPELLDHLHLYRDEELLLSWHDAFANALELTEAVPEERVRALAERFGVAYERR